MQLALLPKTEEYVLPEHRQVVMEETGKGKNKQQTARYGDPLEGAPVWTMRPMTDREAAYWRGRIEHAHATADPAKANEVSCDIFRAHLVSVTNVDVPEGDALVPFDAKRHAAPGSDVRIPFDWQDWLAGQLITRASLGPALLGK